MKTMLTALTLRLFQVGVVASETRFYGMADGFTVRVGSVSEVFQAEEVAKQFLADFGVEVLVCF